MSDYNEYQFVIVQVRSDGFVESVSPTIGDHEERHSAYRYHHS